MNIKQVCGPIRNKEKPFFLFVSIVAKTKGEGPRVSIGM